MRYLCLFIGVLLSLEASAQWMQPKPVTPQGNAIETASKAPANSKALVAWSLRGQADLADVLSIAEKIGESAELEDTSLKNALENQFERPLEEVLKMFSGSGYFVVFDSTSHSTGSKAALVLGLNPGSDFGTSMVKRFPDSKLQDGFSLSAYRSSSWVGWNRSWAFVSTDRETAERCLRHLNGAASNLGTSQNFKELESSLDRCESGLFVYGDFTKFDKSFPIFSQAELSRAGWRYGAGLVDFRTAKADFFLRADDITSSIGGAVRRPGNLDKAFLETLPSEITSFFAVDGVWYSELLQELAWELPILGKIQADLFQRLNKLGDLRRAFSGQLVVGTNAVQWGLQNAELEERGNRDYEVYQRCASTLESFHGTILEKRDSSGKPVSPTLLETSEVFALEIPKCPLSGKQAYEQKGVAERGFTLVCKSRHSPIRPRAHEFPPEILVYEVDDGPSYPSKYVYAQASVGELFEAHSVASRLRAQSGITAREACAVNLRNIASALDLFQSDSEGIYAKNLSELAPTYLKSLPSCPSSPSSRYELGYSFEGKTYKLHCPGHSHPELLPNRPLYDLKEGVSFGPVDQKVADSLFKLPPLPNAPETYEVGPAKLLLDPKGKQLRMALYEKRAVLDETVDTSVQTVSEHSFHSKLADEAFEWAENNLIGLVHLDFKEPLRFLRTDSKKLLIFRPSVATALRQFAQKSSSETKGAFLAVKAGKLGLELRGSGLVFSESILEHALALVSSMPLEYLTNEALPNPGKNSERVRRDPSQACSLPDLCWGLGNELP